MTRRPVLSEDQVARLDAIGDAARASQGLPPKVTDPVALARLAMIFEPSGSGHWPDGPGDYDAPD